MAVYLARKGFRYSPVTIHKYMNKEMGLYAIVRPKKPVYMHGKPHKVFDNKLAQDFTAERTNQKWCTDFTYLFLKMERCVITAVYLIRMTAASLRILRTVISTQNLPSGHYRRHWIRSRCEKENYSFIVIRGHSIHRKHSLSIVNQST